MLLDTCQPSDKIYGIGLPIGGGLYMQIYSLFSDGILDYHERTKHHFNRYARSLGYLDWDTQPNPFRFCEGCESRSLPLLEGDPLAGHLDLYE